MIGRLGSRDSDYILPFLKSVVCENEKKRGWSLGELICRGCLVCLSTYWKERHKPVYINDAKDGLVMKREDSSFNNSDEVEELSAFSFSDSSALPGQ